jgi:hypothetical protein
VNDVTAPSPEGDPTHSAVDPDAVRGGGFDQPYAYPVDTSVAEVVERFSGLEPGVETGHVVSVAGRLMLRRTQGKLAFGSLHDASGQVQLFITTPPSVMQHIQAGKLKGIAVTGKTRHPGLPQVPTTAEAGLPGFELEGWVALFAPTGTPADAVARLASAIKSAVETPDVIAKARAAGVEIRYLPPAALQEVVRSETAAWARTIKSANIVVQ